MTLRKMCSNKLHNSYFAQVDESTDITSKAQLLAFCFIDVDEIVNQFLCCKELATTTKGEDISHILTVLRNGIYPGSMCWDLC